MVNPSDLGLGSQLPDVETLERDQPQQLDQSGKGVAEVPLNCLSLGKIGPKWIVQGGIELSQFPSWRVGLWFGFFNILHDPKRIWGRNAF